MRRLALLLALAATPAAAQIKWGDQQFDPTTCGTWEKLDMDGRIDALKAIEPYGDFLEAADHDAARDWANEVATACKGAPDRLLTDAAMAAEQPPGN